MVCCGGVYHTRLGEKEGEGGGSDVLDMLTVKAAILCVSVVDGSDARDRIAPRIKKQKLF